MQYQLAPMEGITTYIYRNAYEHHFGGVSTYYTPFISPHKDKTLNSRELNEVLPEHNQGMGVVPQILTASTDDFLRTAKELQQMGYTHVNLNCGCPSGTVTTKGKGAGMLDDPGVLDAFLAEIFEHSQINISVKTRIGMESAEEWEDILKVYEKYPLEELIIHPRVREDYYKNLPNKEVFAQTLETSRHTITYNGNLFTASDIQQCKDQFPKLEACMLGRGIIANPGLIQEAEIGKELDKETFRAFHDEVYEGYRSIMSGDRNTLFKMKELWCYMETLFENGSKAAKKVRKADKCTDYEIAVKQLLRDCELLPMEKRKHVMF